MRQIAVARREGRSEGGRKCRSYRARRLRLAKARLQGPGLRKSRVQPHATPERTACPARHDGSRVAMIRSPLPRFPGRRGAYQQDRPSGNRCVRGKVLRRLKPCLGERTAQNGRNRHRRGCSDISGRPSGIGRRCARCKARLVPVHANLRIPPIVLQPRET